MIIVQLKGGLGNQLFQYAAALSLSVHHKVKVKVDTELLEKPDDEIGTLRNYELQHLIYPPEIAALEEISEIQRANSFTNHLEKILPPYKRRIYKEASFRFDPYFFKAGSHIYLKGYRQSEKYFHPVMKTVLEHFVLKDHLTRHLNEFVQRLKAVNSIAVHIRRGDYTNKGIADYHGMLDRSYYQSAISAVEQEVPNPTYFVFSDNVDWVKENLDLPVNAEYVSGNLTKNYYEDFYLMSQCSHNIIANSSFSWWAAWLNNNPKKIVIAPLRWLNEPTVDTSDVIPENWLSV